MGEMLTTVERRRHLLSLLRARRFLTNVELADHFRVSKVTVRNDLDALAERGYVLRVRGGAILSSASTENAFESRQTIAADEKVAIAEAAVAMLRPGNTLILDVGTTTMAIAQALLAHPDLDHLVVFTNGINIALALEPLIPRVDVMVTGGSLRPLQHSLVEPRAVDLLRDIRADFAFIGCDGIHPTRGVTTSNFPEAVMKQAMLRAAHQRVIVADSTKLLRQAVVAVADLTDVDILLTSGEVDHTVLTAFRDAPLELNIVSPIRLTGSSLVAGQ